MMKYCVDIVIYNKKTTEVRFIEKDFIKKEEAYKWQAKQIENFKKSRSEYDEINYNKVYPRVTCSCSESVSCTTFINICRCGTRYNLRGLKLPLKEQTPLRKALGL